jgi:hypothetical protein
MADGIRIRAADAAALASKVVELEHRERLIGGRTPKVYRFRLDDTGAAIVSTVVWERLQRIMQIEPACPRFYTVDTVARPPAQGVNGDVEPLPVVRLANGYLSEAGAVLVPKVTLN